MGMGDKTVTESAEYRGNVRYGMQNWGATQANRFSFFFWCATRRDNSELCIYSQMCRCMITAAKMENDRLYNRIYSKIVRPRGVTLLHVLILTIFIFFMLSLSPSLFSHCGWLDYLFS